MDIIWPPAPPQGESPELQALRLQHQGSTPEEALVALIGASATLAITQGFDGGRVATHPGARLLALLRGHRAGDDGEALEVC